MPLATAIDLHDRLSKDAKYTRAAIWRDASGYRVECVRVTDSAKITIAGDTASEVSITPTTPQ